MDTAEWNLPATIEVLVTAPGRPTFSGSNNKPETGTPFFSEEPQKQGATFYRCDTVRGFPSPLISNRPFPNRTGGSSFIAVKTEPNGYRKVWINASMGAFRINSSTGTTLTWEYQIRYFSGDTNRSLPEFMTIGVVPNSGFHGGSALTSFKVDVDTGEMRIKSLKSRYGGEPYFLKDVDFDVEWIATVDWGGPEATPGAVKFITSLGETEILATGVTNRITLNMGREFEVGTNLVAIAVAPDGTKSKPMNASMVMMSPIPVIPFVVNASAGVTGPGGGLQNEFSYVMFPSIRTPLLDLKIPKERIPTNMPFFGGKEIAFDFIPEISVSVSSGGKLEPTLTPPSESGSFTKDLRKAGKSPEQILRYILNNVDRLDNLKTGLPQLKAWDRNLYLGATPLPSGHERRRRFEVAGIEMDTERPRCERFERDFAVFQSSFRARLLEWRQENRCSLN